MRVRLFELRLLAVGLTVLWAAGGGVVLLAYRPGGPLDLLVGISASLPLLVSVAAVVWPPLVTSNRGSAGIFWLGLVAGLLLVPSIAGVARQVVAPASQPLLPSAEVVYPWAAALLATALFAGLGISRQLILETGVGPKRLAASIAFALIATTAIGTVVGAVSLADDAALRSRQPAFSQYGPTSPDLTPPECDRTLVAAPTAQLHLHLWGDVDGRSMGTVELDGGRSGSDISWTAFVPTGDSIGQHGAIRTTSGAWMLAPGEQWRSVVPATLDSETIDATVFSDALSPGNRATAEDRGLEFVEGARARHCRIAIDGPTFASSFPQVVWLTGDASLETWRGELNYWVFGDGEVGMVDGSVNGNAQAILPHGLLATVQVDMTATNRGLPVTVAAPTSRP